MTDTVVKNETTVAKLKPWKNTTAVYDSIANDLLAKEFGFGIPFMYFGGPNALAKNEKRPYFSRPNQNFTTKDVLDKYSSITHAKYGDYSRGVVVFPKRCNAEDRLAFEMFFANRINANIEEAFFIDTAIEVLTQPESLQCLLDRKQGYFYAGKLIALYIINLEQKNPDLYKAIINGEADFDRLGISKYYAKEVFSELLLLSEEPFAENLKNIVNQVKAFVSVQELVEGTQNQYTVSPLPDIEFANAAGQYLYDLAETESSEVVFNRSLDLLNEFGNNIDEHVVSAVFGSLRYSRAYNFDYSKLEEIYTKLSDDGKEKFIERLHENAKDFTAGKSRHSRVDCNQISTVLAIRLAGDSLALSEETIDYLAENLSSNELAYAFECQTDVDFIARILVKSTQENYCTFLYTKAWQNQETDSIFTTSAEHRKAIALAHAKAWISTHDAVAMCRTGATVDRKVANGMSGNGHNPSLSAIKEFQYSLAQQNGVTSFISRVGGVLGRHRKLNKDVIDFLYANGSADDHLALSNAGCLKKKVANRVQKNYGDQFFGKETRQALERVAQLVAADGTDDRGTTKMSGYLSSLVASRQGNAAHNGHLEYINRLTRLGSGRMYMEYNEPLPAQTPSLTL